MNINVFNDFVLYYHRTVAFAMFSAVYFCAARGEDCVGTAPPKWDNPRQPAEITAGYRFLFDSGDETWYTIFDKLFLWNRRMIMKRFAWLTVLSVLALLLTACAAPAEPQEPNTTEPTVESTTLPEGESTTSTDGK